MRSTCSRAPFFFFNDTATTEIYTLSLHDALPISLRCYTPRGVFVSGSRRPDGSRSEEHTSELQSRVDISYAVFCLKKKQQNGIAEREDTSTFRRTACACTRWQ